MTTLGKIQEARATSKKVSKQVAVAWATYQTASKTARMLLDKFCHVYTVNEDYTYDLHRLASEVALEGKVRLPGTSEKELAHRVNASRFKSETWVPVHVPGVGLFQAKANYGDIIEFRTPRRKDLTALDNHLRKLEEEDSPDDFEIDWVPEPKTDILTWDAEKSEWDFRKTRRSRSFGSVFIPGDLQREIEDDLKTFSESRERLQRLEMPWRRGYLLTGPPGTGKTSLSLAIAGVLGFKIASLSLTDIKSDGMLRQAISQLSQRTVLVIEDIDAYSVSNDRNHNSAKDGALSLSGLLNSLDGFETPDGLVTIATTNHDEHLDPALIRSGRLDRTFHLGHIDTPELERLFKWFYEEEMPEPIPVNAIAAKLAPAEVAEIFKQHLDDPVGGYASLMFAIEGGGVLGEQAA